MDGFTVLVRHGGGPVDILLQLGALLAAAAGLKALASWRLHRSISG